MYIITNRARDKFAVQKDDAWEFADIIIDAKPFDTSAEAQGVMNTQYAGVRGLEVVLIKPASPWKRCNIAVANHNSLDTYVKQVYGIKFNFAWNRRVTDLSAKPIFDLEAQWGDEDEFKWAWCLHTKCCLDNDLMLRRLCKDGHIQPGEYAVIISQ
jgi:hypothetical protein